MTSEIGGFRNEQHAVGELPDYRRVALDPVTAAFVPYAMITSGLFWLIVLVVAMVVYWQPFIDLEQAWWPLAVMAGSVVVGVLSVLVAWLDARRRGWALREHDLIYRYGVIWRKTVIVPFARIQHVETASGPLERKMGLMRVKCFTAGGMTSDLTVRGLDVASARRVRSYLLEQIRDDEDESEPVPRQSAGNEDGHDQEAGAGDE